MANPARKAAGGSATARSRDTAVKRSVSGRPTKAFFVSMLVRDIELLPAVVDLVDNSVDGVWCSDQTGTTRASRWPWKRLRNASRSPTTAGGCRSTPL